MAFRQRCCLAPSYMLNRPRDTVLNVRRRALCPGGVASNVISVEKRYSTTPRNPVRSVRVRVVRSAVLRQAVCARVLRQQPARYWWRTRASDKRQVSGGGKWVVAGRGRGATEGRQREAEREGRCSACGASSPMLGKRDIYARRQACSRQGRVIIPQAVEARENVRRSVGPTAGRYHGGMPRCFLQLALLMYIVDRELRPQKVVYACIRILLFVRKCYCYVRGRPRPSDIFARSFNIANAMSLQRAWVQLRNAVC